MIAIAENVLRILLAIVLIILVVLFIGICIVLFLPIKYRGYGYIRKEERYVELKVRWLWGIVRFYLTWSKELTISLKVFWKEFLDKQEAKDNAPDNEVIETEASAERPEETKEASVAEADSDDSIIEHIEDEEKSREQTPEASKEKEKFSFQDLYDKILSGKDKLMYYIDLFLKNSTLDTVDECKEILWKVWKRIRPKKLAVNFEIGFDSPDNTGYFYGAYCMFSGLLGKNVVITPNFDKQIIEGDFTCKGKIRGVTLVIAAIKLYFHKGLRRLIADVKKGGKKYDR